MKLVQAAKTAYAGLAARADLIEPVALLFARLIAARVFLLSGLNKWNGPFSFNPGTYDLFLYEYFCPEEARPGALVLCSNAAEGEYQPAMQWAVERFANLAGVMEIALPLLLIFGLFTRFAALGLLAMTAFIQLFVFNELDAWWGSHAWWAVALLILLARGPGLVSLDHWLGTDRRAK